jgi:outer membrane receptor for ferrienterochelin and colicins
MMRVSFSFFLLFVSIIVNAQYKLNVHVQNQGNGAPVAFAYVNIYAVSGERLISSSETDEQGNAGLTIKSFPVKVQVFFTGYDPETLLLNDSTAQITISLVKRFTSLNEVVVTGVPEPTKPQNALANYKVISAARIQSEGAVTLNEVLANQLNMSVSNDAVLGAGMRMQGLNGDKVKIMRDGVAMNGREGGNIDLGQINLYNVDRIEIVQGPMSIIYGTDALGGVINVIEKENRKPFELQATANYETVGKYNFNIGGAKSWKHHSFSLSAGRNFFQGWKYIDSIWSYGTDTIYPKRNLLFKPKEQYVADVGYRYYSGKDFKLAFSSNFLKEKITNRGNINTFDPFNGVKATDEFYFTTRSMNSLSLEGKLGKASWRILNGYAYYHRIRNTYNKDMSNLNQTPSTIPGEQDTSTFQDMTSRLIYDTKLGRFTLTAGYDITLQRGISKKISGSEHATDDYALFGMVTAPFLENEKLKLQVGVRGTYNTRFGVPVMPAANILFTASEKVQLRASYAKGFRAPSLKEMYLDFEDVNHKIFGNENLKAEEGDHLQLSVSDMLYTTDGDYLQLLATGYYNNVKNGIMLVPTHPEDPGSIEFKYGNLTLQQNAIASFELEGQASSFHYMVGYSFNYTFSQTGYSAFAANELNSSLFYYWKRPKIGISAFYKFTGAQPFLRSSIDGSVNYDGRQPYYHMLDASLERKFWNKKLGVTVGVKNILNVEALTATGLTQSGIHSGNGSINFLPRSLFTTLRVMID